MCGGKCKKTCDCGTSKKYTGPSIECLEIEQNITSYDEAFLKLGNYLCELDLDIKSINAVSFIQSTGEPTTVANQPGETDTYIVWADVEQTINLGSFTVYNGANGFLQIPITYAEALILTTNATFIPYRMYHITDRDYFFIALDNRVLNTSGYRLQTILKNSAYTTSATNLGVWDAALTPAIGQFTVWGGRLWRNLTGLVGTATDQTSLSSDWVVDTTEDVKKIFEIKYNLAKDWVSKQEDDRGNTFGVDYNITLLFNPVNISDWGSELIFQNKVAGVFNNQVNTVVTDNIIIGSIYNNKTFLINENTNTGGIFLNKNGTTTGNSNKGNINNNIVSSINYNTNIGDISNNNILGNIIINSCRGAISNNSCGTIENNANEGSILNNNNNGPIERNRNTRNIEFNSNSGAIRHNVNKSSIDNNSNAGEISNNGNNGIIGGNTNSGFIVRNFNAGGIIGNTSDVGTTLQILDNMNNGSIRSNNSTASIFISKNNNNGDIGSISGITNRAVSITDTTVDK